MSLLDRAKQRPLGGGPRIVTNHDEAALVVAWIRGDLTQGQVAHALGMSVGGVPSWIGSRIRAAVVSGIVTIALAESSRGAP